MGDEIGENKELFNVSSSFRKYIAEIDNKNNTEKATEKVVKIMQAAAPKVSTTSNVKILKLQPTGFVLSNENMFSF